jgi:hypothetical protein
LQNFNEHHVLLVENESEELELHKNLASKHNYVRNELFELGLVYEVDLLFVDVLLY